MIVLLIFLLICSGLGIAAFVMSLKGCGKDGFDKHSDSKLKDTDNYSRDTSMDECVKLWPTLCSTVLKNVNQIPRETCFSNCTTAMKNIPSPNPCYPSPIGSNKDLVISTLCREYCVGSVPQNILCKKDCDCDRPQGPLEICGNVNKKTGECTPYPYIPTDELPPNS